MRKTKRLLDEYQFPGFHPVAKIKGKFGDSKACIITLKRHEKKQDVAVAGVSIEAIMITNHDLSGIYHVVQSGFI
jgi:hypothetical protein